MRFFKLSVLLLGSLSWAMRADASLPLPLPVKVTASDEHLRYIGRFDRSDPAGPRCAWSASAVMMKFRGTALNVLMKGEGQDYWQVFIDGRPTSVLELKPDQNVYSVAVDLPASEHTVALVKRTEAQVGTTGILGFQISEGGQVLPLHPASDRRLEVIGDSISCGYGNEAPTKEEKFTPLRENGTIAYGALAARQLGADYVCIAWSGKKLWPNNSILDYYGKTLPQDKTDTWDFSKWQPNVVVINLGTNDFGKEDPDGKGWTDAYRALMQRLRKQYPDAWLYPTLGTMLGDWPAPRKPASAIRSYLTGLVSEFKAAGDQKVRFIDFGIQKPENGFGGSWHPSAKTHEAMASQLVAALQKDLGWSALPQTQP